MNPRVENLNTSEYQKNRNSLTVDHLDQRSHIQIQLILFLNDPILFQHEIHVITISLPSGEPGKLYVSMLLSQPIAILFFIMLIK